MGISYDVIDVKTNEIIATFGLKWLSDHTNGNVPNLERQDMIDYCEDEIEKIEDEMNKMNNQMEIYVQMRNKLISEIYICSNIDELRETLQTFLEENDFVYDNDRLKNLNWLKSKFRDFQDFIVPYIWNNYYNYRTEISY